MSGSIKFAISIPDKEFKEMESYRKRIKIGRSRFILEIIRLWTESKEKERLIKIYEEGYKKIPEKLMEIHGWEKAGLSSFSDEKWP